MSRYIGKRVHYECGFCKKQFTLNKQSVDDSEKSGEVFCSKQCSEQFYIADVRRSKRFCTTDLLTAYQAGAVEMYNKIVNSIEKQTLKGLREDSQEWLKLYDK